MLERCEKNIVGLKAAVAAEQSDCDTAAILVRAAFVPRSRMVFLFKFNNVNLSLRQTLTIKPWL